MYASAVCSGKVTPGGKKKNRKKMKSGGKAGSYTKGCGKVMAGRRKQFRNV
jgi:hypothetical protein